MFVFYLSIILFVIGLVFIEDVEVVFILKGVALVIVFEVLVIVVVLLERLVIEFGLFVLFGELLKLNLVDGKGLLVGDVELVDVVVFIVNRFGVGVDVGVLVFGVVVVIVVVLLMGLVAVKDIVLVVLIDIGVVFIVEGDIFVIDGVEILVDKIFVKWENEKIVIIIFLKF